MVFVALILVCCLGLLERRQNQQQEHRPLSQLHRNTLQETIVPIPIDATKIVDLWPDDSHKGATRYRSSLLECIPSIGNNKHDLSDNYDKRSSNHCLVRLEENEHVRKDGNGNHKPIQRVAVVHPPGKLGGVFVQYVTRILNLSYNVSNSRDEVAHSIELVSTSQLVGAELQSKQPYNKIIRMATLPILLDATDLLLAHADATAASTNHGEAQHKGSPKLQDVLELVRQLVRFQCHISKHSANTALLTITLDRMMGFSSMTTKRVQSFLGLTPPADNPKQNRIAMDDISLVVTDIIDQASSMIQRLLLVDETVSNMSAAKLNDMVNDVVDEELNAGIADASSDGIITPFCRPLSTAGLKAGGLTNAIIEKMMV